MTIDWTASLAARPPSRRYPFWARRDRRRAAQAMAGGRTSSQIALVNRVSVLEVETLLRDEEFQELLRHYRSIAALSYAERIARLAAIALEIVELGLETGDMRVAMFVLHEQRQGRDPARSLAERAVARIEAAERAERPEPERTSLPCQPPCRPAGEWDHCAATRDTPAEAEALAVREARRVRSAHRRVLDRLAERLLGEAERMGTAVAPDQSPSGLEAVARGVARCWQERPEASMRAAARLQAMRELNAFGAGGRSSGRATGPPKR